VVIGTPVRDERLAPVLEGDAKCIPEKSHCHIRALDCAICVRVFVEIWIAIRTGQNSDLRLWLRA
jgi:hypothetical protein